MASSARGGRKRKERRGTTDVAVEIEETFRERASALMSRVLEETIYKKPLKSELHRILEDLFRMYSPTGQERVVVDYCAQALRGAGFKIYIDKVNNLFAIRGVETGEKLVCINAHTDTVQSASDKGIENTIHYQWYNDIYTGQGKMLGGDDKCGIAVALTLGIHTQLPMKIILTAGEEIGGTGVAELLKSDFNDVAFCFTVDRRGGNDIIAEYCGRVCAPAEFVEQFIALSQRTVGLKYATADGSYADTYTICEFTPCLNLSAGYYNAHTANDFVDVGEMYLVMMTVKAAIENKYELISAIDRAPKDWFKDKYANNPLYNRGKYIGTVSYYDDYGSWGGYSYGGLPARKEADAEWDSFGRRQPVSASTSYQRPLTLPAPVERRITTRTEDMEARNKCKVVYGKIVGRDDVEPKETTIEDHERFIMSTHQGVLLAGYNDGITTDEKWDEYLASGEIPAFVHRIGVEQRVRNKMLHQTVEERNRASAGIQKDTILATKPKRDADDLLVFKGFFNESVEGVGGEEEKLGTVPTQTASWAMKDAIEDEAAEELLDISMQSGYLSGSVEHGIFVDYVTGNTSVDELRYYVETTMITPELFDLAVSARHDYEAELRLKKLQRSSYDNPLTGKPFTSGKKAFESGQEMARRHQQPGGVKQIWERERDREAKAQKKLSKKEQQKEDALDVVRVSAVEKNLIRLYAMRYITDAGWDHKWQYNEISPAAYRAGQKEAEFYEKWGKLSGRFTVDEDAFVDADRTTYEEGKKQKIKITQQKVSSRRSLLTDEMLKRVQEYAVGDISDDVWFNDPDLTNDIYEIGVSARAHVARYGLLPDDLNDGLDKQSKAGGVLERARELRRGTYTPHEIRKIIRYAKGEITFKGWGSLLALLNIDNAIFNEGLWARQYVVQFKQLPEVYQRFETRHGEFLDEDDFDEDEGVDTWGGS